MDCSQVLCVLLLGLERLPDLVALVVRALSFYHVREITGAFENELLGGRLLDLKLGHLLRFFLLESRIGHEQLLLLWRGWPHSPADAGLDASHQPRLVHNSIFRLLVQLILMLAYLLGIEVVELLVALLVGLPSFLPAAWLQLLLIVLRAGVVLKTVRYLSL